MTNETNNFAATGTPATEPEKAQTGGSRIFRTLVTLAVLAALLGAGGYYAWQRYFVGPAGDRGVTIEVLEKSLEGQKQEIEALNTRLVALGSDNEALRRELSRGTDDADALNRRLREVERSLSALRGISESSRNTLLVAEARYFLELAGNRLSLEADPESARAALEAAARRLTATDDPSFNAVLAVIQEDIEALGQVTVPDIDNISRRLSQLAPQVGDLAVRSNVPDHDGAARASLEEESGIDRAITAVGSAFKDMFRVRRTDEDILPLLAPKEEYFLRQNLLLKLESARLAALRRDAENYSGSLATATQWLDTYFDDADSNVTEMRYELESLASEDLATDLPDISGSLALLRRIAFAGNEDL